ncbi:SOSS complex subunit C isoform X6 [Lagenorhynchus albirostris]|uniref:SOSS complex subunit C isoform X6 n=1 Tax=Lagenorhynchus albirostris TaxID=27610 RepID=UPI0028E5A703|nr:SOSS complex subunit C isoform X6 [Lagenorhynchus albirostris]
MAAPFRFFLLRTATAFLHLALVTQTSLVHQTESSLTCDAQPFHSTGRGRNQTGKPKEETEKGMYWGRKMGCTPSGAPVLFWERARKRRWNRLKQAKRFFQVCLHCRST